MTRRGRVDLILEAARSIAAVRPAPTLDELLGTGATDDGRKLADAAAFAVSAVVAELFPDEHAAIQHADAAFGDRFTDLLDVTGDVSFAVGMSYALILSGER